MKAIIASTFVLYLLVTFAIQLLEVPTVRLFEIAICDRYFRTTNTGVHSTLFKDIDESSCKIPPIQNELAEIAGWKTSFDAVPGLLTALWYGSVADRYGQRLVLFLSLTGSLMGLVWIVFVCKYNIIFAPQMVWISSIFLFIGGGVRVFNSVIFSIISDSLGHSQRTKFLYLLAAGPHINRLISPRVATFLMGYSIYVPFWVAITTDCICLLMLVAWPNQSKKETFMVDRTGEMDSTDADSVSDSSNVYTPLLGSSSSSASSPSSPISSNNDQQLSTILKTAVLLLRHPASRFCFITYILKRIAFASEGFMFQYASEKFLWPLHQTTWLRVGQASGAILATLILCPLIMSIFSKTTTADTMIGDSSRTSKISCGRFSAHVIDLTMIRSALSILTLSFFAAWKAPSAQWQVAGSAKALSQLYKV
ncbi:conserved hypothetical protein [Talaromyces stipitatus ATCC 10500]|uniref:MFS transporter n=1 Tax=Talaromyces stipitatus (strain ATCC 10500 / CBS 375.48 / QM 6759 / NRRL 1006) TaxID=441959 RepID=B8ME82_TALSN|nr:uncharacterized protein TSTA_015930 [Talaromyces stipitatus ATCC 10500]EED16509.1 conserved hypothetical protein [Talaromyces stipitatus ATCC 10500]